MKTLMGWTCAIALATGCAKKSDNSAAKTVDKPPAGSATAPEGSGGSATADKLPPPPADDFDTHMKAGNALEDQKKWPEALAEFEAAVAQKADDARALNEVAFTAFGAGKLDRAKEAALAAAAAAAAKGDKKVHGQALFNLGLAVEQAQPYSAVQLYLASLAERPNKGVRARLARAQTVKAATLRSPDDTALLDKVGVKPGAKSPAAPAAPPSSTPGSKEDQALMAALEGAGVEWESGAGKSVLLVENLQCTMTGKVAKYACTTPAAKDKAAEALVKALAAKKVAGTKAGDVTTYKASSVRCRTFNEGDSGAPDECEVTP